MNPLHPRLREILHLARSAPAEAPARAGLVPSPVFVTRVAALGLESVRGNPRITVTWLALRAAAASGLVAAASLGVRAAAGAGAVSPYDLTDSFSALLQTLAP